MRGPVAPVDCLKPQVSEKRRPDPVTPLAYYGGWSVVVLYNMGLAFYVCLFG